MLLKWNKLTLTYDISCIIIVNWWRVIWRFKYICLFYKQKLSAIEIWAKITLDSFFLCRGSPPKYWIHDFGLFLIPCKTRVRFGLRPVRQCLPLSSLMRYHSVGIAAQISCEREKASARRCPCAAITQIPCESVAYEQYQQGVKRLSTWLQ